MTIITIYGLRDPETGEIRYIGQTKNGADRLIGHIEQASKPNEGNKHKRYWIASLLEKDLEPEFVVLDECTEHDWKLIEQAWIAYGRDEEWPLTNMTDGGEGLINYTPSEETRKKLSAALRARQADPKNHPMYGKSIPMKPRGKSVRHFLVVIILCTGRKAQLIQNMVRSILKLVVNK